MDENSNYLYGRSPIVDHQFKTNNSYGTYPGKNSLSRHNINKNKFPLLQSTTNSFKVDWQLPINSALLPPLSPCRISPITKRKTSASSPQKDILKCNVLSANSLNINSRPLNMFDCPTSSSTFTLGNNIEPKSLLDNGLNTSYKSINKHVLNKPLYKNSKLLETVYVPNTINSSLESQKNSDEEFEYRKLVNIFRIAIIEFFALTLIIFSNYHIQFVLRDTQQLLYLSSSTQIQQFVTNNNIYNLLKIVLLSVIDATPTFALFVVFPTLHLNPVITIAHFFSAVIPFYISFVILCAQFIASIFGALVLFFTYDNRFIGKTPNLAFFGFNDDSNHIHVAYQLVFNQFLGTTLVTICHIRLSKCFWRNRLDFKETRCVAIFGAIWLSSFLSFTRSNVSWNPLAAVTMLIERFISDLFKGVSLWNCLLIWQNHYLFWMGPILGALFGCFLCRIAFTPYNIEKVQNLKIISRKKF